MKQTFSFNGHMRPGDVRPNPYVYLPFTVPPRTARIDVFHSFDEPVIGDFGLGIGNEVGIGIFDPRGVGFLEDHGFRGWSGAARHAAAVHARSDQRRLFRAVAGADGHRRSQGSATGRFS